VSGRYLTDLADVCRRAGLVVTEVGGSPSQVGPQWQQRARSSGGYANGRPTHVMVHHTASGASADGWGDANYCTFSSENRPVCNLYLSRAGHVWVCAAGATNTNGSGGPIDNVPKDSMNTYAVGIEAGNSGTGEPWPQAQQDAYVRLVRALGDHYGLQHCRAHFEWAPGRKVDPAGPSQWAPGGGSWNMNAFRESVIGSAGGQPPPKERAIDMAVAIQSADGTPEQQFATFAWQPGCAIGWLTSDGQIAVGHVTGALALDSNGKALRNFGAAEIQDMIDRYWVGGPKPPGWR
jgi:hypothetical protein